MLKVYNTFIQRKEFIKCKFNGLLKIYVCGITVYDYCHFGHARIFIFFDTFIRYLRYIGFNITYIRNITDIDDKIILKSKNLCVPFNKLTLYFINFMKKDFKNLNLLSPTYEPKVTYFINYIVYLIFSLNKIGFSYQNNFGDLYYFVNKYLKYGNISNRSIFDENNFSRQNIDYLCKNFLYDFVLWKFSNIFKPFWKCYFGEGRPGWHVECSTMSMYYLGDEFDIHGGGLDLIFPHHENECAQSEGLTKKFFSSIWMHIGIVEINKLKMSKSLKNCVNLNSILQKYNNEVIRYFILLNHYRTPLEFCYDKLNISEKIMTKFYLILNNKFIESVISKNNIFEKRFFNSINNDINLVENFSVLFDLVYEINCVKNFSLYKFCSLIKLLKILGNTIGFFYLDSKQFLSNFGRNDKMNKLNLSEEEINELVFIRFNDKLNNNWKKADFIRDYLFSCGILLEDKKDRTLWKNF
ncbi:MAG: cysteine--tRNA ligase [Candidatus Azosocius agrarius]|nr:MAG: cysteine--tRNA ligase [Gammaproteobacteria bacterium]